MTGSERCRRRQASLSDRTHVLLRSTVLAFALSALVVPSSFAEIVVGPANFPESGDARTAIFRNQVDVGACRMLKDSAVTIRRDGTVSWRADVASVDSNDAYCTRLIFVDRNDQRLFTFPFICSSTLTDTFRPWERHDLAIPEHIFSNVKKMVRNDKC
jgi:hypothetical protein